LCLNGQEDTRDQAQQPDANGLSCPWRPICGPNWGQNVSTQTRDGQRVRPPLLLPGPARQRHQGQSTPKPRPPVLALSPEPYCDTAARPDPCHICCPPFELLLARGHSSVPASPRAAAGNAARPVHHPLPRPRPPATTPRTFLSNCQADFEVQTSALFVHLRRPRLCPGASIWPFQSCTQMNLSKSIEFFYNNIIDTSSDAESNGDSDLLSTLRRRCLGIGVRRGHARPTSTAIGKLATTNCTRTTFTIPIHSPRHTHSVAAIACQELCS
jgi:hypothetical protein